MVPKVFQIPILDKWLVYAPLQQSAALINRAAASVLRKGRYQEESGELSDLCDLFRSQSDRIPQPLQGDVNPLFLGIIPTRDCNMGCLYCSFGGAPTKSTYMKPEIAVAAVDWIVAQTKRLGKNSFHVQFFGGEPFVAPEIVEIVVHRSRYLSAQHGLIPYFDASTNGLFSESQCKFIGDYFDTLVLSLDGPPEFHDKNRPTLKGHPTFSAIERTVLRLSEMPIDLCIRMCITQESVSHMEEISQWMIESFNPFAVSFETLIPGKRSISSGLRPPDPYQFARHVIGAYDAANSLGVKAIYSAVEANKPRQSFCPVGNDAVIVSPDGRISACYLLPEEWENRGLDLNMGWVHTNGGVDIFSDALTRIRQLPQYKPRCKRCFCQYTCAGGCHVNQTYPGCDKNYTDFCIQTRIVTACLLLRRLGAGDLSQALLNDMQAMQRLAQNPIDHIVLEAGAVITDQKENSRDRQCIKEVGQRPNSLIADGWALLG